MIKRIGLITYQANHLKTEQVFKKLIQYYPPQAFSFYALPFVERPERKVLFQHRPDQSKGMDTESLAATYGCPYLKCERDIDIPVGEDIYLILGAGILSAECIHGKRILNAHPGAIPASRGLDAFKWAIYDEIPVGNSLHFIDASVDSGDVVAVLKTPVYQNDSLASFAQRHYDSEIQMMADFSDYLAHPINECPRLPIGESHRRMKLKDEELLSERFESYKSKYAMNEIS